MTSITTKEQHVSNLLKEMVETAARMRSLIVGMPPEDLIGYLFAQIMMKSMENQRAAAGTETEEDSPYDTLNQTQFLLEYVHAVLASDHAPIEMKFDELQCAELIKLSRQLREQAMIYAMASSVDKKDGFFGPDTADIEFRAKSIWVILRGNRYQVLEGEFYRYVLAPHDDVLTEIYGVGSTEIGLGFQKMADAIRTGHADAISEMMKQFEAAQAFAVKHRKTLEEVMPAWVAANEDPSKSAGQAMDDMFRGGIANVSRHTNLPQKLLADLAYQRGEDTEFFGAGDFTGTPFRTLPARKKPLIQLGDNYYAVDPSFTRDAGYRAILFNLLQRKPDYKKTFEDRQKAMSEGAFPEVLAAQLLGGKVYQEVYYKDPVTKQWSENDTLILLDDVLYLVEAKAGAAATIASPALDFKRHIQSVQDLVIKAYKQCERFFNYLHSADEVPIYHLNAGKYTECARIRLSDYRVLLPIGLTIESFSPFSAYCKELPQIEPLLGKYSFISMSIDDLFVLKRFLPTSGEFAHYMEVRQSVAGIRRAHLFDEFDHLGAYIKRNRFDKDIGDQLKNGNTDMLVWDGMSAIIDRSFEGEDWQTRPKPAQEFPDEILKLLKAIDRTRAPGWLLVESYIRNFGEEGRKDLAIMLSDLAKTLDKHPARYFVVADDAAPLFVWMQSAHHEVNWKKINDKASAAAIHTGNHNVIGLLVDVNATGIYSKAQHFKVHFPSEKTEENAHLFEDAQHMNRPNKAVNNKKSAVKSEQPSVKKVGRNEQCPCGSGKKYKKCHGL